MKLIEYFVFTGPESSGKSTLVNWLAHKYNLPHNTEFARTYLTSLNRKYVEKDLYGIAEGQLLSEQGIQKPFICDSDLLTIVIWLEVVFKKCDVQWHQLLKSYSNRHYFLLKPDIPWEADPLRENPDDRDYLFTIYQNKLDLLNLPYTIISGFGEQRMTNAETAFKSLFYKAKL